jgi:hypothetical protein
MNMTPTRETNVSQVSLLTKGKISTSKIKGSMPFLEQLTAMEANVLTSELHEELLWGRGRTVVGEGENSSIQAIGIT